MPDKSVWIRLGGPSIGVRCYSDDGWMVSRHMAVHGGLYDEFGYAAGRQAAARVI